MLGRGVLPERQAQGRGTRRSPQVPQKRRARGVPDAANAAGAGLRRRDGRSCGRGLRRRSGRRRHRARGGLHLSHHIVQHAHAENGRQPAAARCLCVSGRPSIVIAKFEPAGNETVSASPSSATARELNRSDPREGCAAVTRRTTSSHLRCSSPGSHTGSSCRRLRRRARRGAAAGAAVGAAAAGTVDGRTGSACVAAA